MTREVSPEEIVQRERELRDREGSQYDLGRPDWEVEAHKRAVLGLLALKPGETLLDAGAGTGAYVPDYLAAGANVIAVDHSEQSLALAHERVPREDRARFAGLVADLRALPLDDASADRAVSLGALQHIPTGQFRRQAVREILRCLRPRRSPRRRCVPLARPRQAA